MSRSAGAASLPCDILAGAGTPCVAAHSMTRALFADYNGPLYQVQRSSDSTYLNIETLSAGGYANAAAQNSFCANTSCIVTSIYDQTSNHNNLTIEGPGGHGGQDEGAPANALPVYADGNPVYGLYISAGMGYRDDSTTGVATNGEPEGMYMVTSGTHFNASCCFDYGNAETNEKDNGDGHMDAINFSNECWFSCYGNGPWVQADLENGLYDSGSGGSTDSSDTGLTSSFVTAALLNNGQTDFALMGGNAQSGGLTTFYSGALPSGYSPMKQEGAIVLGTGGDDSNGSTGSFFEGVMTSGMPSGSSMNSVQSNIVSVGYATTTTSTLIANGTYIITGVGSGLAIDDPDFSKTDGEDLDIYTVNDGTNQQWTVTNVSTNVITLTNGSSGQLVDVAGASKSSGALVDQWPRNGQTNQEWNVISLGGGAYELTSVNSGLALSVIRAGTGKETGLEQLTYSGSTSQQWKFTSY